MIIECCSQERTYLKFYGLMAERFCKMSKVWVDNFIYAFNETFDTVHRYETNRLRNIAKLFGHIFYTDSLSWACFSIIRLTEDDTTSASRIFIKILFQEISEAMGLAKLKERFNDPDLQENFAGLFPKNNPKDTRFAINYWTSIGLGALTDDLREWLRTAPQQIMKGNADDDSSSGSDSDSDSDSSSSGSSSGSESDSGSSSSGSDISSSDSGSESDVSSESSVDSRRRRSSRRSRDRRYSRDRRSRDRRSPDRRRR